MTLKSGSIRGKIDKKLKTDYIKSKKNFFFAVKYPLKSMKKNKSQTIRLHLQTIYSTKDSYLKYIKNTQNSTV